MVAAIAPLDLGTYRNMHIVAKPDKTAGWILQVVKADKILELPITDYSDDASPAMKAAMTRLASKLEHPEPETPQTATDELTAQITAARANLDSTNDQTRLRNGRWETKYALYIEEVKYLAQVQRSSADRAAILAYADRRLAGAVDATGKVRWMPFNEQGIPTFYFDEDLCVEDTLYWLWQNTKDLMRVFHNNPPADPFPVDEVWLAAITTPRTQAA